MIKSQAALLASLSMNPNSGGNGMRRQKRELADVGGESAGRYGRSRHGPDVVQRLAAGSTISRVTRQGG